MAQNADKTRVRRVGQTKFDLPLAIFHLSVLCWSSVLPFRVLSKFVKKNSPVQKKQNTKKAT